MKNILFKNIAIFRRSIYMILGNLDRIMKRKNNITILCYHSIASDSWEHGVSFSEFKRQISYLEKAYSFISLDDLYEYFQGKKKITKPSMVLTIDDGYKDVLQLTEFLKRKKIIPTLFVLSNSKSPNRQELGNNKTFLSDREIKSLQKNGWIIGCHSSTHSNLAILNKKNVFQEVIDSKEKLEERLGFELKYFAYPRGKYNSQVLSAIRKAKYKMALTMDDGKISRSTDLIRIPRVGVVRSHTFEEFQAIFSPSVIAFRRLVKATIIGRFL